jgi:hypothetical protein
MLSVSIKQRNQHTVRIVHPDTVVLAILGEFLVRVLARKHAPAGVLFGIRLRDLTADREFCVFQYELDRLSSNDVQQMVAVFDRTGDCMGIDELVTLG